MECFVIMPFPAAFDDVYAVIKSSVETALPARGLLDLRGLLLPAHPGEFDERNGTKGSSLSAHSN